MQPQSVTYADVVLKQRVEAWAETFDGDPESRLLLTLEEVFRVGTVTVLDASQIDDGIMFSVVTEKWSTPKEFVVLNSGSVFY